MTLVGSAAAVSGVGVGGQRRPVNRAGNHDIPLDNSGDLLD